MHPRCGRGGDAVWLRGLQDRAAGRVRPGQTRRSYELRMKAQDNVGVKRAAVREREGRDAGVLGQRPRHQARQAGLRADGAVGGRDQERPRGHALRLRLHDPRDRQAEVLHGVAVRDRQVQVRRAGRRRPAVRGDLPRTHREILDALVVRGCKLASKICGGPQPPPQSTPVAKPARSPSPTTPRPPSPPPPRRRPDAPAPRLPARERALAGRRILHSLDRRPRSLWRHCSSKAARP
jgi:hypothetical protein